MSETFKRLPLIYGLMARFENAAELYEAAKKVRDAGFKRWDVHSPFPIHGMDEAMGVKRSILPWLVFLGGATGTITALVLQFGTQVFLYPTIVQSKPANLFTIPAFVPVMFELTILCAAFSTLFGLLMLMRMPRWHHPLFNSEQFARFSDDAFFMVIEARDLQFDEEKTKELLQEIGGKEITLVEDKD